MRRLPPLVFVAVAALVALGACSPVDGSAEPSGTPKPSSAPEWSLPTDPPSPAPTFPPLEDPTDPVVIAYCSVQDKVITLEGRLLTDPPPTDVAVASMRRAQRAAALSVPVFQRSDQPGIARLAQRWADSFDLVIARLEQGMRPIDALRPAISALGAIERRFSCELDG